jgi:hypothetical protein
MIFQSCFWTKPLGISMVQILLVGAGGGGGGGFTGIAASSRAGGGGGGGGAISRLSIPAIFLPDTLKITIGAGGTASTGSGVAGGAGSLSTVEVARGTGVASSYLLIANGGGGGGAGTAAARGTAGTAGTVANATNAIFSNIGVFAFNQGQAGVTGGIQTGGLGTNVTFAGTPGIPFSSGAGGAGVGTSTTNYDGGYVNTGGLIVAQQTGGLAGGGDGYNGVFSQYPFYSIGGSGGGSNNSGAGGKGGNGSVGCGGGGGGAGTTGGGGGTGGNGLCIITCW